MDQSHYSWRYIFSVALEYRPLLIKANLIALLATCASVPLPLLMPMLVDEVLLNQPETLVSWCNAVFPPGWQGPVLYITAVLLLTVLLRVAALVFNVWQGRQFSIISKEVIFRIRAGLLQRLKRISMAEYEALGSGSVSSHFITDLDTVDRFVGASVSRLLIALLTIIGTAVVLIWMNWQLALFILLLNPLVVWLTMTIGKQVKELKKQENRAYERFQGGLTEVLEAIYQIRAANRENHYLQGLVGDARSLRDHATRFEWRSEAANRFSFMVFLVGFDMFRALSMGMVVFSDLSIGQMMAVFGYLWFMMGPVQEVLGIQYAFYGAKAALQRINRLAELDEEPDYPHLHDPFTGRTSVAIELRDIHFSYIDGQEILRGLSLTIDAGQKIALVGASGGGKSTLVQVLLGLYQAQQGQVLFAGVPVEQIGLDRVRENVATVLQHPALFNDSVRGNLTLGRTYTDQQLWKALEVAQLAPFVEQLESGLDTVVGRQGVRLSGGQRQRLAIARMVLTDPKVVVLDEATSALDAETEYNLHRDLASFLQGRTTIIVAHRLSAVKQADHVYVFEDGQVAEQGDHEQLLQQNGLYARLYGQRQH
ncbi:ABC transporter ATP-binding protein [Amphritea pacifica]|uniref:ABC transporter ATP-binding protein n=1 Tax=Amphritea pacifica TaxID=2811233 RepID=A0ABS2WB85_9GAMM|nr:ABC transporter ATP-binding protein [Amphritea pacifica]MBN0988973.1 ABC transporter ATP-binding protein [Amphritea pacifica]MBN1005035.1 ABC transporter ATP-binding protein [Amphritea pacifica]